MIRTSRLRMPGMKLRNFFLFVVSLSSGLVLVTCSKSNRTDTVADVITQKWNGCCTLDGHRGQVRHIAFSQDGRRLVTCADDLTIRIWDVNQARPVSTLQGHLESAPEGTRGEVDENVEFTGGEKNRLISVSSKLEWWSKTADDQGLIVKGNLRLWDASQPQPVKIDPKFAAAVAISPRRDLLAAVSLTEHGSIRVLDRASLTPTDGKLLKLSEDKTWPVKIAFSPDGSRVAASYGTKRGFELLTMLECWDRDTGRSIIKTSIGKPEMFAFRPDGRYLCYLTATNLAFIDMDDPKAREASVAMAPPLIEATRFVFSSDDSFIFVATGRGEIEIRSTETGERLHLLTGHQQPISALALSGDGKTLASGDKGGIIRLWQDSEWTGGVREKATN